ncbi:gliding motility-associated C-terminal domain-containing protein [Haliscomenobacter hydrossis]|uniref:Gliding motility-associated C-terminal domain-containing protein n=1 Tax=Haliscomenobacter hydrossis (strain ATCC 27775 / DSM 1100 / LMG 10767 / O) TaxID=760192 RepID=F4KTX2_HALH1|nr:T9SS C-terminal target domain-containing protein [Haliscomenobacter hydrossis]AEE49108.1 hypothetical protein Halhy_1211 [Haliscomenobacter hydrossis DSM 1100]
MGKLYILALLVLFILLNYSAGYAQGASDSTTFILTSRKVCVGDTIDIPVRAVHFRRVAGFQFAVSWASGQFRFLSVRNSIFPSGEFDFEAPASRTRVNFAWFKSDGTSTTLADTTQIFILRLVALQPGNPATLGFVTNPRDQTAPIVAQFNQAGNNIREFTPPLIGNTITILAVPTVQATTDTITCAEPYVFLDALASDTAASYAWTGPNGFSSNLARDTAFFPGRYQVIVTSDICSSEPLDLIIGFDQTRPTVPTLSADSINCLRRQAQLRFSPVDNTLSYFWVTPLNDTIPAPISSVSTRGIYKLLVVQPRNGCLNSAEVRVNADTIAPGLRLFGRGQLDCRNQVVQLSARSNTQTLSYNWQNSSGGTIGQDSTLSINAVGTYRISLRNLNSGCVAIKDTLINADLTPPSASVTTPGKITCANTTVLLSANVGTARTRSFWLAPSLLDTLARTATATARSGGVYTFLVLDTINGCSLRLSSTVESDTVRPVSLIRVATPFSCVNTTAQLAVDALTGINYSWSGQGLIGNNNAATVQIADPGLYRVLLENPLNACTFRDSLQVGGSTDGPRIVRINLKQPPCVPGSRGSIGVDVVSGGLAPYTYALQDSTFSGQRNFSNLVPGTYQLKVQDAAGCESDTTLTILESVPIEVSISALGNEINPGDSLQLSAVLDSSNLASIAWAGTDLAPCNGCMDIQVSPTRSAVYQVLVESSNGCKSQAVFNVFVVKEDQVFAPNVFSPNGDNKNDRFYLAGKKNLKIVHFRIFDRWGNLVYEVSEGTLNDEALGWDGTYGGKVVPPGTFVWVAELETEDKAIQLYSGEAILLR